MSKPSLRGAIFGAKPSKVLIEHAGATFEVREPSLGRHGEILLLSRDESGRVSDSGAYASRVAIACVHEVDGGPVFEEADMPAFLELPASDGFLQKVVNALNQILDGDAKKNSKMTQSSEQNTL